MFCIENFADRAFSFRFIFTLVRPGRGLDVRGLEYVPPLAKVAAAADSTGDMNSTRSSTCAGSTRDSGTSKGAASNGEDCPMDEWVVVGPQKQKLLPQQTQASSLPQSHGSGGGVGVVGGDPIQPSNGEAQAANVEGQEGDALYDLWGVVNHYGGLGGGHYTAFARNDYDDRWYEVSDDLVSVVENDDDLVTAAAYVLFYQRRGGRAGTGTGGHVGSRGDDAGDAAGVATVAFALDECGDRDMDQLTAID